jgi:hypothetical protein
MHESARRLHGEGVSEPAIRDPRLLVHVRSQELLIVLRERVCQGRGEVPVRRVVRREGCRPRAELGRTTHRDDRRREPLCDLMQDTVDVRAAPIDLVHEQERRNA